jgi:uncharacterized tellurite resistance protein B-like protein
MQGVAASAVKNSRLACGRGIAIFGGMIADILNRLRGEPASDPLSPDDARTALAALMVRLARSDGRYSETEQRIIDAALADRFGLDAAAARALRADAEETEAQAPDTVRFTRMIKDDVPYEEREGVVEALWRVALTDGGIGADERGFLRLVANLLGVSDQDSGLARQRVERDLPG